MCQDFLTYITCTLIPNFCLTLSAKPPERERQTVTDRDRETQTGRKRQTDRQSVGIVYSCVLICFVEPVR